MITIQKMVSAFIGAKYGSSAAVQFEATFDGEEFEEQNMDVLAQIEEVIYQTINSDIFTVEAIDELEDYLFILKHNKNYFSQKNFK